MKDVLEIVFRSPFSFFGTLILLHCCLKTTYVCWSRFMRMLSIRKRGWPTPPLDADGDVVYQDCGCEDVEIHSKS